MVPWWIPCGTAMRSPQSESRASLWMSLRNAFGLLWISSTPPWHLTFNMITSSFGWKLVKSKVSNCQWWHVRALNLSSSVKGGLKYPVVDPFYSTCAFMIYLLKLSSPICWYYSFGPICSRQAPHFANSMISETISRRDLPPKKLRSLQNMEEEKVGGYLQIELVRLSIQTIAL